VVVAEEKKKLRWFLPLGIMATGLAGAAVVLFRGCWHSKMSWPIRVQEHSYQVCLSCGIKRLFHEKDFQAYGPHNYDLNHLIAWNRAQQQTPSEIASPSERRSAS
jgi:hypothetical protein